MDSLIQMLPAFLQPYFQVLKTQRFVFEIRFRVGKPVVIQTAERECFLSEDGYLCRETTEALTLTEQEMDELFLHLCKYSVYAYSEEIKQGFFTLPGGHRVGIAGQAVTQDNGQLRNVINVCYLNIRVAHEVRGVSADVLPYLYRNGQFLNTLIVSPPGGGKTTLLRDLIRNISDGNSHGRGVNVAVVDERSEIAGSYMGKAQNDIGIRTDVLDGCPKCIGMMILLRSMTPVVIAVDELGNRDDIDSVYKVASCGCKLLATIHGDSYKDLKHKRYMSELLRDRIFDRYVVLHADADGERSYRIYDEEGTECIGFSG